MNLYSHPSIPQNNVPLFRDGCVISRYKVIEHCTNCTYARNKSKIVQPFGECVLGVSHSKVEQDVFKLDKDSLCCYLFEEK